MTTNNHDRDYEVGYGKPPKKNRFEKGQSGNPKGRPKGAKNIATLLKERLYSKIPIMEHGRRKQIPAVDALFGRLLKSALEGDARAQDRVIKLLPLAATDGQSGDEITAAPDLDETDDAILRCFIEMGGAALFNRPEAGGEDEK